MADVIVIGGGVNGLVAAAWLARRKFKTVLLEARPAAGGAAITTEIAPGFRMPALSHALGPVHRDVVRALDLDRAPGLEFVTPDPSLTAFGADGASLVFHRDPVLTAAAIHRVSPADAARWREFLGTIHRVAAVLAAVNRHPPPAIDDLRPADWWRLLGIGRRARALGPRDLARLLRWMPMAISDLVSESLDHELLRAAIAARAIFGNFAGPRSAGTGAMWLQRLAEDPVPVGGGVTAKGGPGALATALVERATRAGAEIATGARVVRILTASGRVSGVALEDGREMPARAVVAAISPRRASVDLVDPADLPPEFLERMRHTRARGVTAKINLALSDLPAFTALEGDSVPLRGRLLIAPHLDYLERAHDASKYGEMSPEPWLEASIPSVIDPSLATSGHVMSIYVQAAPRHLKTGAWSTERDALYRRAMGVLESYAPGVSKLVVAQETITPEDLETGWGLPGGHIWHGETTIDQSWVARPLLGWSQYRSPIGGLFFASAGTHPGGGLTGMSGLLAARTVERALRKSR